MPASFRHLRLPCYRLALIGLLLSSCVSSGCVRRRMTIRSNPPGALVFVDDQRIGVTPVSTSFTYYGTRKIQLFKDGFETQTVKQRFHLPWYQFPPLDFITENLWPRELRDERVVEFDLLPQRIVPSDQLVQRASELRTSSQRGHLTPLPNSATAPVSGNVQPVPQPPQSSAVLSLPTAAPLQPPAPSGNARRL